MKLNFLLSLILIVSVNQLNSQSLKELKSMQSEKASVVADFQAKAGAAQAEVDGLQKQIDILTGWRKGYSGHIGFDWKQSNGWIASPNPDSRATSLNIGLNVHALMDKEKLFWHNKGMINKAWSDVDLTEEDRATGEGLFKNGTVDILNISSLAGYKLSSNFALSGLGELNTSVSNFLNPGTFDLGVGATWLPSSNMSVVIHPFNYHLAFSGVEDAASRGSAGSKVRLDYFDNFTINNLPIKWSTTLTTFVPYKGAEAGEVTLFEYSWLNSISLDVFNGLGIGFAWGLRNSKLESSSTQSYTSLGLTYGI